MYVGSHFSGRSKAIEIRTKTSGKSKINHNDDIFSNHILKTPEKTSYIGFHFTGIRSKATEIMSKSTGIRSKITGIRFGFTENLNLYRKARSRLRNHVKTRQKNYHTNVANFSTLDRNFEILEFFRS